MNTVCVFCSFQSEVYNCLANCKCCSMPWCQPCTGRSEELKTEVLVKLADISKAMSMNGCTQGIGSKYPGNWQ